MDILTVLKKAFLEGYATGNITIPTVLVCVVFTALISGYIYLIYKFVNKNSFYSKTYNLSLIVIAMITSSIILTVQSNIVVSLGMVGALSIVRFRTAIKDPMDLAFLFWAISVGIICGAGFAFIAIIASLVITAVILAFNKSTASKGSMVLVVNADSFEDEEAIMNAVNAACEYVKVRARNASKTNLNMAVEVKVNDQKKLVADVLSLPCVKNASLVEHDGNVTA